MMQAKGFEKKKTSPALANFCLKLKEKRIPACGNIEITRRCNFDCIHCYLGDKREKAKSGARELTADQWKGIIDEIIEGGCLFLSFSGGEPTLREDFYEVYRHARRSGAVVSVLTNGYRVGDDLLELFGKYPPKQVEMSIYGASPATYSAITGRSDGFESCLANLDRLLDAGVTTKVKTVLLSKNWIEIDAIEQIARSRGLHFRFDAGIFPRLDGDKTPIQYRVRPRQAAEKYLSTPELREEWLRVFHRTKGSFPKTIYGCSAATTSFHIDWNGMLRPCLMVADTGYDLLQGDFDDGWKYLVQKLHEKKTPLDFECKNCDYHALCGYCPAFFRLENGSEDEKSSFLCEIGHRMAEELVGKHHLT